MKAVPFQGTLTPQSHVEKQNVLSQPMNPTPHLESPTSQMACTVWKALSLWAGRPIGWKLEHSFQHTTMTLEITSCLSSPNLLFLTPIVMKDLPALVLGLTGKKRCNLCKDTLKGAGGLVHRVRALAGKHGDLTSNPLQLFKKIKSSMAVCVYDSSMRGRGNRSPRACCQPV